MRNYWSILLECKGEAKMKGRWDYYRYLTPHTFTARICAIFCAVVVLRRVKEYVKHYRSHHFFFRPIIYRKM
jgi:hypothetical protein